MCWTKTVLANALYISVFVRLMVSSYSLLHTITISLTLSKILTRFLFSQHSVLIVTFTFFLGSFVLSLSLSLFCSRKLKIHIECHSGVLFCTRLNHWTFCIATNCAINASANNICTWFLFESHANIVKTEKNRWHWISSYVALMIFDLFLAVHHFLSL